MKSKEPPKYGRKKQSHNKLRSEIKNTVVSAIIKYNEHNKIYNSCSLQLKQVIVIKIILLIVLNVDLEMLTSFSLFSSSFVFYLILALLFICIIYIFFEFGIPQDFEILDWCPAGPVLPHGEKVPRWPWLATLLVMVSQ